MNYITEVLKLIALYDERRTHWYNRYIEAKTDRAAHGCEERYKEAEHNCDGAISALNVMGYMVYIFNESVVAVKDYERIEYKRI